MHKGVEKTTIKNKERLVQQPLPVCSY